MNNADNVKTYSQVFQFKITLMWVTPTVWRKIEVPCDYTFWDLHVAIQDAMGWLDCHHHAFNFKGRKMLTQIGIPSSLQDGSPILPGWSVNISEHFKRPGGTSLYQYDFGDGWLHTVVLERILPRDKKLKYPRCIDGGNQCPPEDCGGAVGYEDLCEILRNPKHPEYQHAVKWMAEMERFGGRRRFDEQNPGLVRFRNPRTLRNKALSNRGWQKTNA